MDQAIEKLKAELSAAEDAYPLYEDAEYLEELRTAISVLTRYKNKQRCLQTEKLEAVNEKLEGLISRMDGLHPAKLLEEAIVNAELD